MEVIRKKICVDNILSHKDGIMPFIKKDENIDGVSYVNTIADNSNYNSFPCDFALVVSELKSDESGIEYRDKRVLSRLRYLDVIKNYNKICDLIRNGIVLKRRYNEEEIIDYVDCVNDIVDKTTIESYSWTTMDTENISKFNCIVTDFSYFSQKTPSTYIYNGTLTQKRNEILANHPDDTDYTEEELTILNDYDYFIGNLINPGVLYDENYEYFFLINNYDFYNSVEEWWNSWWEYNFTLTDAYSNNYDTWEQYVFDNEYIKPIGFKFIYDIDNYVVGKIEVPEIYENNAITGIKVPNVIYYLNYYSYLKWFIDNEGGLMDENLKKEWDQKGGYAFYNFLRDIQPKFLEVVTDPEVKMTYFDYVSPLIEIPLSVVDEFNYETVYQPYEYSLNFDGVVEDAVIEYTPGNTHLNPSFKTYDEEEKFYMESKLKSLISNKTYYIDNETYGLFDNFDGVEGCMFQCVYHEGESSGSKKLYRTKTINYYVRSTTDEEWEFEKEMSTPEFYISTISDDILPLVENNDVYQVVGIEEIGSNMVDIPNTETQTIETRVTDNGLVKIETIIEDRQKLLTKTYSWYECFKVSDSSTLSCKDGENVTFKNNPYYRNILILSCVPDAVGEVPSEDDYYYFMVRYNNGYVNVPINQPIDYQNETQKKVFSIPYETSAVNIQSYDDYPNMIQCDIVYSKEEDEEGHLIVKYAVGVDTAHIWTTGVHYKDTYFYSIENEDVIIDGLYKAKLLREKIVPVYIETAYSEDLNNTREYIKSEITGMEVGTQWTKDGAVKTLLFTEDFSENLLEYPKVNVNITYNRGNAAAWERHFKLSECNTFSDLENYGNGFFENN